VGDRPDVRIVYLKGERELIARRLTTRHGHFMPPTLLDSQFAALEEPTEEENPIVTLIEGRPHVIVDHIVAKLSLMPSRPSRHAVMPDSAPP
jgi:carbohydrate kinase (thermoresistant glucokinase family)